MARVCGDLGDLGDNSLDNDSDNCWIIQAEVEAWFSSHRSNELGNMGRKKLTSGNVTLPTFVDTATGLFVLNGESADDERNQRILFFKHWSWSHLVLVPFLFEARKAEAYKLIKFH
uniref:Uncharacterized protein n=1 Tax=Steinernema glaseri TaxID=37863 RepID=A0A1I7Z9E7_9BILA